MAKLTNKTKFDKFWIGTRFQNFDYIKKQKYSYKCYKRSEEMKAHSTKRCRLSLKLVLNVSDHPIEPPDEGETFLGNTPLINSEW